MTGNKGGGDIELCDIMPVETVSIPRRTSQVRAAHLLVPLTPAEALTHFLPGHAGVIAGVVGLVTNVLAVLIGVITLRLHRGVTSRGLGQLPTFTALSSTQCPDPGTGLPGIDAAVLICVGLEGVSETVRSAVTGVTRPDAQIPAHGPLSVVTGVGVGGVVTRPHSSQHQRDY